MTIPRSTDQPGISIVKSVIRLVFGTSSNMPAAGDHDHATTGLGTALTRLVLRGGLLVGRRGFTNAAIAGAGDFWLEKTAAGTIPVQLPGAAPAGTIYFVGDGVGDANTNPTTVTPASGTVNGAASIDVDTVRGLRVFISDGTNWRSYRLA
jgi:hypothetical protein